MAAHSMTLSWYNREELKRFLWIVWRSEGVMGHLLGRENFLPSALLIPLIKRYSCWYFAKSMVWPFLVVKCLTAAMCNLTLLCEL